MSRRSDENSRVSSTTAHLSRFLQDTRLSDEPMAFHSAPKKESLRYTHSPDSSGGDSKPAKVPIGNAIGDQIAAAVEDPGASKPAVSDLSSFSRPSPILNRPATEESPVSYSMASTPQLDLDVAEETHDNKYHKLLRYMPNADFHADASSIAGPSVPNTFKHKSHPNAQTKDRIGLARTIEMSPDRASVAKDVSQNSKESASPLSSLERESAHNSTFSPRSSPGTVSKASEPPMGNRGRNGDPRSQNSLRRETSPIKTSTVKGLNISHDDATPSWMPPALNEKWEGNFSPQTLSARPDSAALDFLDGESNTFVHNPPTSTNHKVTTPDWKRVSEEYKSKLVYDGSPLQDIFQASDDSKHTTAASRQNSKTGNSLVTSASNISTPVASRDTDVHLTQQQINQLEDMLEKAKDEPDDYQIKGSPLKLFGSDYDTFTKAILTKFVEKVRSNATSARREPMPVPSQLDPPKLKIKNFTQSSDYTNKDFLKNANSLFAQIQRNAYKSGNLISKQSEGSLNFHSPLSNGHSNATSTPKATGEQRRASFDDYSSFSTDFGQESISSDHIEDSNDRANAEVGNEYTPDEKSYLSESMDQTTEYHGKHRSNDSSYTFDEFSDLDDSEQYRGAQGVNSIQSPKVRNRNPLIDEQPFSKISPFNDNSAATVQFLSSNQEKKDNTIEDMTMDYDRTFDSIKPPNIKWKTASQLKLVNRDTNKGGSQRKNSSMGKGEYLVGGIVKPGSFPKQYGNMIFDSEQNKWVSNDKENDYPGSLDSIEDLDTASNENELSDAKKSHDLSILKSNNRQSKKADRNLEVSFQVPNESGYSLETKDSFNVTHLSELNDMTFTQSNKMLVSLITGSMDEGEWEKVTSIDLSSKNLERVERLERYLPAIRKINLSDNHVKFISGLPESLLELNVSRNDISNITSFEKFRDLQILNCSFNGLSSLRGLSHNIHLTKIDLSSNDIESLSGLENLTSLISLNLSQNNVSGTIDFTNFSLSNLQELNLAENKITSLTGIETLRNLRVLNLNENKLERISCREKHRHMKKLLLKFNKLKDLDLAPFPSLRILRIDGNYLESINGSNKLEFLQELSIKCQANSSVTERLVMDAEDVVNLDLSGNSIPPSVWEKRPHSNAFANLNILNLSAVGLTNIPPSFGETFSNVRELNLNFNKLSNLEGLSNLTRLKRLNVLSNNIDKVEMILRSLSGSRETLKILDMRLNSFNFEFYPYVFNPQELEYALQSGSDVFTSPIQLEAHDDIENFSIHYDAMNKSQKEWEARDAEFFQKLRADGKFKSLNERLNYETILIGFFPRLRILDGGSINRGKREQMEERIKSVKKAH
ncbi:hypothetical protein E0198_004685 [Clavispora lusitaniae]|nr:hypothetical protein E0198_004685 [Clavispora lusitaniae]